AVLSVRGHGGLDEPDTDQPVDAGGDGEIANFYSELAEMLRARRDGTAPEVRDLSIPTGVDGLIGVRFVEAAVTSHAQDGAWVDVTS
ncbi:MAG TPA: hypothetical protein VHI10_00305, partial [Mycobacterium sp.]|nr:hypothetical protein [Mycobacterium sp.]